VHRLVTALANRDRRAFEALLADDVTWELSNAEGGPATLEGQQVADLVDILQSYDDQRVAREVCTVRGSTVVRHEGRITPPGGVTYSGSGFSVYDCDAGRIASRRVFGYRKDVLDALGLPRGERQGVLVVRDDDDDRLYHFSIARGSAMRWARYADLGNSDHDHCELCWTKFPALTDDGRDEGYATADGNHWLCPDCFDEVKDHFALTV
jgi:ketosteroid isomerase-like protein